MTLHFGWRWKALLLVVVDLTYWMIRVDLYVPVKGSKGNVVIVGFGEDSTNNIEDEELGWLRILPLKNLVRV